MNTNNIIINDTNEDQKTVTLETRNCAFLDCCELGGKNTIKIVQSVSSVQETTISLDINTGSGVSQCCEDKPANICIYSKENEIY